MPRTSVVARVTLPNFLLASAALLASACQADISGTPRSASPAGGSGTAGTSSSGAGVGGSTTTVPAEFSPAPGSLNGVEKYELAAEAATQQVFGDAPGAARSWAALLAVWATALASQAS